MDGLKIKRRINRILLVFLFVLIGFLGFWYFINTNEKIVLKRRIRSYEKRIKEHVEKRELKSINLSIDDAQGLKEGAEVLCEGVKVGEVNRISFVKKMLNIELNFKRGLIIPKNSEFFLISSNILGTKAISIELSEGKEFFSDQDTLRCLDRTGTKLDTTLMIINSTIEEVKDSLPKMIEQQNNKK